MYLNQSGIQSHQLMLPLKAQLKFIKKAVLQFYFQEQIRMVPKDYYICETLGH